MARINPPEPDAWMLIGRVAGAFGVHGEMKVELHTDFPERFAQLQHVFLGPKRQKFEVEGSRLHGGRVLLKLRGINAPEAIGPLRGQDIVVPRAEAMPLAEGHFYLDDVVGLSVVTPDGRPVGRITDVIQTGSNDVFVVGEGRESVLIPVIKDAVRELDIAGDRVVVEPWVLESG